MKIKFDFIFFLAFWVCAVIQSGCAASNQGIYRPPSGSYIVETQLKDIKFISTLQDIYDPDISDVIVGERYEMALLVTRSIPTGLEGLTFLSEYEFTSKPKPYDDANYGIFIMTVEYDEGKLSDPDGDWTYPINLACIDEEKHSKIRSNRKPMIETKDTICLAFD